MFTPRDPACRYRPKIDLLMIGANPPILQMVRRLLALSRFFRCGHGTHELRLPSHFRPENTIYERLLWLYHHDHGFCIEGEFSATPPALRPCTAGFVQGIPVKINNS
jgi:hypothetical protein